MSLLHLYVHNRVALPGNLHRAAQSVPNEPELNSVGDPRHVYACVTCSSAPHRNGAPINKAISLHVVVSLSISTRIYKKYSVQHF